MCALKMTCLGVVGAFTICCCILDLWSGIQPVLTRGIIDRWLINNRNLFLTILEVGKFKMETLSDSVSDDDLLPDS